MAAQPDPPWVKIEMDCVIGLDVFTKSRFYYAGTAVLSPLAPGVALGGANDFVTRVGPLLTAYMATDCRFVACKCSVHTTTELQEAVNAPGTSGTAAGDALPAQDCGVITWDYPASLVGGRITRGRSFISGIDEGGTDSGLLGGGQIAALTALAAEILAPLTVAGEMCALQIWRPSVRLFVEVNDFKIDDVIKTLRHRRPGS
jgi:hypothetical protein